MNSDLVGPPPLGLATGFLPVGGGAGFFADETDLPEGVLLTLAGWVVPAFPAEEALLFFVLVAIWFLFRDT